MATELVVGSRLKPRYDVNTFDDGSKQRKFAGWFDTARKVNCEVFRASDGAVRCLPQINYGARPYGFTDPACLNRLATWGPFENPCGLTSVPSYVETPDDLYLPCEPGGRHGRALIEKELPSPPVEYFKGGPTLALVCSKGTPSSTPGNRYFTVGPDIPPTEFVAAKTTMEVP
ncbi:MAG: hypothetical protein NVS3B20_08400 [Polyangiales bacterium]